jgi:microcystin-dependent protein
MWSGSIAAIPAGWALCNGQNGTPDLRDRFIVGAGSAYTPGATGGANSVTLTTAQIPSHTHAGSTGENGWHNHSGTTDVQGNHTHSYDAGGFTGEGSSGGTSSPATQNTGVAGAHAHNLSVNHAGAHTHDFTTTATGGGGSHENRPPYLALAFIMKL